MHLAALNHYLRAVAIVFDFMNPVLALWRLIDRGSKLGRDKGKERNAEHARYLAGLPSGVSECPMPRGLVFLSGQAWQLGDVARYPSRLILCQHPERHSDSPVNRHTLATVRWRHIP